VRLSAGSVKFVSAVRLSAPRHGGHKPSGAFRGNDIPQRGQTVFGEAEKFTKGQLSNAVPLFRREFSCYVGLIFLSVRKSSPGLFVRAHN
jgi:hypothetical protein